MLCENYIDYAFIIHVPKLFIYFQDAWGWDAHTPLKVKVTLIASVTMKLSIN